LKAPCVANHSLNASLSLRLLGIRGEHIVPWDRIPIPDHPVAKTGPGETPFGLLFVGSLSEDKGLGDCIEAVCLLESHGLPCALTVVGQGDENKFRVKSADAAIADAVNGLGRLSNAEVREAMRRHDVVIVPSRHSYPEVPPNTLIEGLASRTPVIASDHPAFASHLVDGLGVLTFRVADPGHLAKRVRGTLTDSALYADLIFAEHLDEGKSSCRHSGIPASRDVP
jgi:glycosyltransferase involved in cell wall biosynthesis